MAQLSFLPPPTWSVTELTRHIRQLLEEDSQLQDAWVMGEVSNFSRASSGHIYFTIKDASASLKVVMWRQTAMRQPFIPRDGDAVEVHGSVSVYEAGGAYQLYADTIRPTGEGLLYQEFVRLKNRLEAEGLFAPERKRLIPRWPRCIGIITSPTGAALRDMLNTLRRRYPLATVVLAPTQVQGNEAPMGIVKALEQICRVCQPDVILVARGGGSIEDLWAFNDERVVRAIAASPVPVISGVGHETDFTLADFAADLRAATPTAAAEQAGPDILDLRADLDEASRRLAAGMQSVLADPQWELNNLSRRLDNVSPAARLRSDSQRLDDLARRVGAGLANNLRLRQARLAGLEQRLAALSPVSVLNRGYAVLRNPAGQLVHSVQQVTPGERLRAQVSDGEFEVRVEEQDETANNADLRE